MSLKSKRICYYACNKAYVLNDFVTQFYPLLNLFAVHSTHFKDAVVT